MARGGILAWAAAVFLILSIAIAAAGWWYYAGQKKLRMADYGKQLGAIADLKIHEIQTWRRERLGDAWVVSRNPALTSIMRLLQARPQPGIPSQDFLIWLNTYQSASGYRDAIVFGAGGQVLYRMRTDAAEEPDLNVRRAVADVLHSGAPTLTDLYFAGDPAASGMDVLAPIPDSDKTGRSLGLIDFHINPFDYLYPLIQTWPMPSDSGETLLVRREGDEVLYLNELRHRKGTAGRLRFPLTRLRLPAAAAALGRNEIVEGTDYRDVPVLAATRAIPDSPWSLVAKVDLQEILLPVRRVGRILALLCLALIGAAAGASSYLIRREQVRHLRKVSAEQKERIKAEYARAESEAQYKLLFDEMTAGFAVHEIICDAAGRPVDYRFLTANRAFETLTGLKADDILGRTALEVIPDLEPSWIKRYGRVALTGEAAAFEDYVAPWNKHYGVRVFSTKPGHFATIVTDITDRKRAEQEIRRINLELDERVRQRTAQLEEANRELEAFSYSVSHDLRAPLRIIDGFSEALLEDYAGRIDKEGRGHLDRIRSNAQFMGQLIDDMLKLARVSKSEIQTEEIDLSGLARRSAADIARAYPAHAVDLAIADGLAVCGDPRLLRAVLNNLFDNAWKFTVRTPRPRVEFGASRNADETVFFVRDNGVGFDMNYVGKLFGIFQRLHDRAEFPGTGIGLATVQRIVRRLGGRVWAEGEVGRGATFFFTLNEPERRIG